MSRLRDISLSVLAGSGLPSLFRPVYGGHTTILCLHRVRESDRTQELNLEADITPEFLERFLVSRQQEGWRFISLDHLADRFDECVERKRNIVITLDDGYRDNRDHAYPIFRKHGIPFTIYIATSFPNGTANLWWYALADVIRRTPVIEIAAPGGNLRVDTGDFRAAYARLRAFYLRLDPADQRPFLEDLRARYGAPSGNEDHLLNWEDIAALAKDPLCTIGCHTVNHLNLRRLSDEDAFREIQQAKAELEERLRRPVLHFAYPYGSRIAAAEREESLAQKAGFRTAVTTRIGNIFSGHRGNFHMLPRIPFYEGGWRGHLNDILQSGMYSALTHPFRRVITQ